MLALVLNCIDRLNIYNSVAHFAGIAREESGMAWKEILKLLYKLLGKHMQSPLPDKISRDFCWTSQAYHLASFLGSLLFSHLILTQSSILLISSLLYFPYLEQVVGPKGKQMLVDFAKSTWEPLTVTYTLSTSVPYLSSKGTRLECSQCPPVLDL